MWYSWSLARFKKKNIQVLKEQILMIGLVFIWKNGNLISNNLCLNFDS